MATRHFKPEQIIHMLREAEINPLVMPALATQQ
jgi:hypothetical protein